jgi:hypothetical protein
VRVLEALKILEDATLHSKERDIDTADVTEALDLLDPYCLPKWRIDQFRQSLTPHAGQFGPDFEGQQQVLRVSFAGIHDNVRKLLLAQIGSLNYRHRKTRDEAVKAEVDRLNAELEKLPERWEFRARSR